MTDQEIEEAKDRELLELATNYGKAHGRLYRCLPLRGIVKLVMETCPTWKKLYGDLDPRGAGMSIGRRISKLGISQIEE